MKVLLSFLLLWRVLGADHLANGFEYRFERAEGTRVSLSLIVKVGVIHERKNEEGIAHFVEHLVFRGSDHFQDGEIEEELYSLGVELPEHIDALTAMDTTVFRINIPRQNLDRGVYILSELAAHATFDEEAIESERPVVIQEIREKLLDPQLKRLKMVAELLLGEEVPHFPPGDLKVIEEVSRDILKQFYHRWYRSDRMTLVIQGDVDEQVVHESIERQFGSLVNPEETPLPEQKEFPFAKSTPIIVRANSNGLPMISMASLVPHGTEVDQSIAKRLVELCGEGVFLSSWCIRFVLTPSYDFFECGVVLFDEADESVFNRALQEDAR